MFFTRSIFFFFFFQAEDGIRDKLVTGVQTCALPISPRCRRCWTRACICGTASYLPCSTTPAAGLARRWGFAMRTSTPHPGCCGSSRAPRSEEHTSELQSLAYLVCRLLLEKKKFSYADATWARIRTDPSFAT